MVIVRGEVLSDVQYETYKRLIASGYDHSEAIKMLRESEEKANTGMLKGILVLLFITLLIVALGA